MASHLQRSRYASPALRYEFELVEPGPGYLRLKRIIDVVVAVVALVLAAPVMALVAIAVRVTGRPILFRQVRLGQGGQPFTLLKFRSMRADADPYAPKPAAGSSTVTRVGAFLRATGLDELPQFINVLRGDMSLVGPRPEMPFIVESYDWIQRLRMTVRPGLTGLWQVSEVRNSPIHHHIEYDLFYLAHRSGRMDLWLMMRTPLTLFLGRHIVLDRATIDRWMRRERPRSRGPVVILDVSGAAATLTGVAVPR